MEITTKYNPKQVEDKWYSYWIKKEFFDSTPDNRTPYTIVIPPPNITGVLHMGHMLNNTIQDVLVRRARMQNKNACWVPGTDHASIATEAKVVAKLKEQGIKKTDLTRKEFLKYAWKWKKQHGDIILEQLKKLGASCDWNRTKFTMDNDMSESVTDVFIDLYNKGYIYRGVRMINWDTKALTALSDEEVVHKEINSKLYYLRYKIENTNKWLTIATTRPETILGDTAICVNPNDERYKHLKNKKAIVPLINRSVPIIYDEYVYKEFGTGALKITPAHDINDYKLGIKYKLDVIDIFNDNGTLNKKAQLYIGKDRFAVREEIVRDLKKNDYLVKTEDYINKIGFSERTDVVIEPKLSMQWFCNMKKLTGPALKNVLNDNIKFYPAKFKNTYYHWMENVKDWCISRQLWWGHRIPAYYLPDGKYIVAKNKQDAFDIAQSKFNIKNLTLNDLKQEQDVLDTWFSSWLWPISVFDGIRNPDNKEIKYYYPTDDLVTAPEILFFWVARMIMAGYEYCNEKPFKNVYLTGIVRDEQKQKMSKSLGNSPDPIKLINKYGADGVRVGMLLCSPAGNDLLFNEKLCEQGRNFSNKIWNAFRLIKGWEINDKIKQPASNKKAIQWFDAKLNLTIKTIDDFFSKYRLSDALMCVYKFFWNDFCSWYLEIIKSAYQQSIDKTTYDATIVFFEKTLKILHPFMPFITEEIWHLIKKRNENDCIIISLLPKSENFSTEIIKQFEYAKEVVIAIRNVRKEKNISFKSPIDFFIKKNNDEQPDTKFDEVVAKLCNIKHFDYVNKKIENAISFIVNLTEFYIPFEKSDNTETEIKMLEEKLKYTKAFLNSVTKKLENEKFIKNAPEKIVEIEQKKRKDAEDKIKVIETKLKLCLTSRTTD